MCFENCIEFPWYVVQRQGIKSARSILNYYNVKSNSYVHALVLVGHFVLLEESLEVPERLLLPAAVGSVRGGCLRNISCLTAIWTVA